MLHASASPWARCRTSAEVHRPTPGKLRSARSACAPDRPRSVRARRPAGPRYAPGSGCVAPPHRRRGTPARHPRPHLRSRRQTHPVRRRLRDRRPVREPARRTRRTSSRQARKASLPVTTCSIQAGASASNTASVRSDPVVPEPALRPRPAVHVRAAGAKPPGSSSSPTSLGSWSSAHSAPSPQARAVTSFAGQMILIRAGPTGVRVVRNQRSPSSAVGRVAGAAAMQRRGSARAVPAGRAGAVAGRRRSPRRRPTSKTPSSTDGEPGLDQQHVPRCARCPRLGFGQHHPGAVAPRQLQEQRARPRGRSSTAPGRRRRRTRSRRSPSARRSVEADVTHDLIIGDDLVDPPVGISPVVSSPTPRARR